MSKSNYPGIDYSGPGSKTNRDPDSGIRYGVISQHSINQDVMSDIWQASTDLSYEHQTGDDSIEARQEALDHVIGDLYYGESRAEAKQEAITELIETWTETSPSDPPSDADKEGLWETVSDRFGDSYNWDEHDWLWEQDGYRLENCLHTDVFVSKSPYFTYAQFCSPCVPGAGNLDSPYEGLGVPAGEYPAKTEDLHDDATSIGFPKAFCLGHDFFDNDEAPYLVFSVATGELVRPNPSADAAQ